LRVIKPETATQVRGRIEQVLDYAKVLGHRQGENPARWKGHLDHLLPPRAKVAPVQHHRALHYRELPAFMEALRQQDVMAAKCLEFTILCACRSGEAIGAVWSEIDFRQIEARTSAQQSSMK
jgi:integrase